ncbi:hypothetical protein CVU37_03245 [candidate division BRC1 bacterium HGW-BRC1-1]|jgi:murein DD-endopeptidase MepM/ murein hydrolase activator NlpD|nr:MAG: hypothetical protein CVU37_03245 [candidate division BRC1 bacterium HGW-BRC1-1]
MKFHQCFMKHFTIYSLLPIALMLSGCVSLKLDKQSSLPAARSQSVLHRVRAGDTLEKIAATYNIPPAELSSYNRLSKPGSLVPGSVLRIPSHVVAGAPPKETNPWTTLPGGIGTGFAAAAKVIGKRGDQIRTVAASPGWLSSLKHEACPRDPSSKEYQVDARSNKTSSQGFSWPVSGNVSRGYSSSANHRGLDICTAEGTPLRAAAPGMVIYTGNKFSGYGNIVIIDHGNDVATVYGHNKNNLVQMGQSVNRGEVIATVGQTGNATTPHVHFEIRQASQAIDPRPYLP